MKLFHNPDELPNRAPTLRLLADLIEAARKSTAEDPEVLPEEGNVPLSPYKDEVLGVLTVGLKTASALPAIDGLKSMVRTGGLLTDEELGFVVHNVNDILQKDEDESEIRCVCSSAVPDLVRLIWALYRVATHRWTFCAPSLPLHHPTSLATRFLSSLRRFQTGHLCARQRPTAFAVGVHWPT